MKRLWLCSLFVVMAVIGGIGWNKARIEHRHYLEFEELKSLQLCPLGLDPDDFVFRVKPTTVIRAINPSYSKGYFAVAEHGTGSSQYVVYRCRKLSTALAWVREQLTDKSQPSSVDSEMFQMIGKVAGGQEYPIGIFPQCDPYPYHRHPFLGGDVYTSCFSAHIVASIFGHGYYKVGVVVDPDDFEGRGVISQVVGPVETLQKAAKLSFY